MSLILPTWVAHLSDSDGDSKRPKRNTIFSLSVHPDGSRLATAGLDSKIRIWSTEHILSAQTKDDKAPEGALLCTLSRHTGSVLVVRWSPSGRFLASGSDDTICLIWDIDPTGLGGGTFGASTNEVNLESWRTHRRLAGHESDVADLAWSKDEDDAFIATVGLDSVAYIWSGPRAAGSGGFERLKRIDSHNGFVKGVVWDPNGQFLATASDDKTVKVWRTRDWGLERTIDKPFQKSPSNTFFRRPSWSPDGQYLLCANAMSGPVFVACLAERNSWEGNLSLVGHENAVTVTAFNPRFWSSRDGTTESAAVVALGSQDQSISIWMIGMNQPLLVARDVFDRAVMDLSWSADGLTLFASSADGYIAAFQFDEDLISKRSSLDVLDERRKRWGYDARRVIASGLSQTSSQVQRAPGTLDKPNVLMARKPGKAGAARPVAAAANQPPVRLKQQITITKDGKRRIKPTTLGGGGEVVAAYGGAPTSIDSFDAGSDVRTGEKRKAPWEDLDMQPAQKGGRLRDSGRTLGGESGAASGEPVRELRSGNGAFAAAPSSGGLALPTPPIMSVYKRSDGEHVLEARNFAEDRPSEVRLTDTSNSTPKVVWLDYVSSPVLLAAHTATFAAVALEDGTVVVYTSKGRRSSTMSLAAPVFRLEASGEWLVAILSDGQVLRWNVREDRRVGGDVSIAGVFAADGGARTDTIDLLWVHSNGTPVVLLSTEKAYALDAAKTTWSCIASGWFADCSAAWESRSRGRGAVSDGASSLANSRDPIRAIESLINDAVFARSTSGIRPATKPPGAMEFELVATLRHLETRMMGARLLESAGEYKATLVAYARRLAEEGIRNQAEDLLKGLLGPIYFKTTEQERWEPTVLGMSKRDLLADALRAMKGAKGNLLQGLVQTYVEHLRNVSV